MSKLQEFVIFLTLCVTLHEIKICFFDLKIIDLVKIHSMHAKVHTFLKLLFCSLVSSFQKTHCSGEILPTQFV